MEIINVSLINWRKQVLINKPALIGTESEVLECESISEILVFDNHDNVLYSDAVFPVLVETGLVGDTHSNLEFHLRSSVYALRTLMNAIE